MRAPSQAIGIFDSGVGGLTVMRQLMRLLPQEHLIYFGDTARLPYGNKGRDTIVRYSIENALYLMQKNINLLIVACNTASALALRELQERFTLPIIGMIEPGAEKAIKATRSQRIAILGTKGTIQSGAYQEAICKRAPQSWIVPVACPLFVSLVEEQWLHHPASRLIVQEYLQPLHGAQIDTVLLGCTHYPLLTPLIQEVVGDKVTLVDPALGCAERVSKLLDEQGLLSLTRDRDHEYYASDDPEKFRVLAKSAFDHSIHQVLHSASSPI